MKEEDSCTSGPTRDLCEPPVKDELSLLVKDEDRIFPFICGMDGMDGSISIDFLFLGPPREEVPEGEEQLLLPSLVLVDKTAVSHVSCETVEVLLS
jgi:hypothetical protein